MVERLDEFSRLSERYFVLSEADSKRDRDLRNKAEGFYNDLISYLKRDKKTLYPLGYFLDSSKFWADPDAKDLFIALMGKNKNVGASISGSRYDHASYGACMQLNIFDNKNKDGVTGEKLAELINKGVVVHEFIHFMDKGTGKQLSAVSGGHGADYYNASAEWQAYWQQGAQATEEILTRYINDNPFWPSIFVHSITTLEKFYSSVIANWHSGFIENMNDETKRKFDKRMAALWEDWKDRLKKIVSVSDDILGAVMDGFEAAKDSLKQPTRTPKGKIRSNPKSEKLNAYLITDEIISRLGKYKRDADREKIALDIAGTLSPNTSFNWDSKGTKEVFIARRIADPILRSALGLRDGY